MWNQSSYKLKEGEGCLFLVPTPIGNLQDMTYRAIEILKEVDYIAAEDTRHTKKLCHYFQIDKRLISYHEHNKYKSEKIIIEDVKQGKKVALVSDAGMPAISDPGHELVQSALQEQISVISLPGPNAALTALVSSGLGSEHFLFFGFLERQEKKRRTALEQLLKLPYTLIFYESPHRLKETLASIYAVFSNRKAALVRELSKKHEEYIRGDLVELIKWSQQEEIRGEFTIVIEGWSPSASGDYDGQEDQAWWQSLSIGEHVLHYVEKQVGEKEALKQVAKDRHISKREVYQEYHLRFKHSK